jgi:prepilin signal peptidase PulO-like enzyme (type II secretory pathway)
VQGVRGMSIVEIIEVVFLLIVYFAGGFAVWDDVIDWKEARLKEILLLIFWFPVIFTLMIVFIVQEIFSFVMKKVSK